MIHTRTMFLVMGLCLVGALAQDCSEQVMQDSVQVSFERNRRTGEVKSLDTVEVTFDYGKVQDCVGDEEEPTLFIFKGETWEEITGGRKRRNTWNWNVAGVQPCQANYFKLKVGDQEIDRVLDSVADTDLVDLNFRLGAPQDVRYDIENQVIMWSEVTCATGYFIEMVDLDGNLKEIEVNDIRLSSDELSHLAPCQEMELYLTPFVIESDNRNSRDEAEFRFEKFPDFSKDILTISDVTSNSVDMKVQLDSLRCVESLSVAITAQDSDDTLETLEAELDDHSQEETIRFENLNQETDYEFKIAATPFQGDKTPMETKVLAFKTLYDGNSLEFYAFPREGCCSVEFEGEGYPKDHGQVVMERSYDGEAWQVWEHGDTNTAEEPVCTEIRYRVSFTHEGETYSKESEPIKFELDATMDLEAIAKIVMVRSDNGDGVAVRWTDIPCIGNYSIKVCSTDDWECEEAQVAGKEERFVQEVDPCRQYTVTITPHSDEYEWLQTRSVSRDMKATITRPETLHISHEVNNDEVIFSWEKVQCVSDFEFRLISEDGADKFPSHGPTFSENKVVYSLAEFTPCESYRGRLDGEYHNTFFSMPVQELGVLTPVGDFSQTKEELNLEVQGYKITWSGSSCASGYRVTVIDINAETVFDQTAESGNDGDMITVEVERDSLEECKDYKAEIQTIWKDVSLPSGQFGGDVVSVPLDKLLDTSSCRGARGVNPKVKSSSLKLPNVSSASTFDNSVILLLVSSYAIYKVFRV